MTGAAAALRFVLEVRRDAQLRKEVAAAGPDGTLADLVRIARGRGVVFTEADARQAIRHEWSMRWHRYAPSPSADRGEAGDDSGTSGNPDARAG